MSLRKFMYGVSVVMGVSLLGRGRDSGTRSPFAGTYVGAFSDSDLTKDAGAFAIVIAPTGTVTVLSIDVTSTSTGVSGSGQMTEISHTDSAYTAAITIGCSAGNAGNNGAIVTGSLTLNTDTGLLTGSLTNEATGQATHFSAGLASKANSNTYAGLYSGTYTINGAAGTPANRVTLVIDSNGKITGFTTNNVAGQINAGANVQGTVESNTGASNIGGLTGTLTLTHGVLQGDLINSAHTLTYIYFLNANQ